MFPCLLLVATALPLVLGLKVNSLTRPNLSLQEISAEEVKSNAAVTVGTSKLPSPQVFYQRWSYANYYHQQTGELPSGVQLVLGVFAVEDFLYKSSYLDIIENTWMNQRKEVIQVCWLLEGQHQRFCTVYVAYILGSRRVKAGHELRGKEIVLGTGENMNKGKTFEYFRHISENYPWATHIGKMDLDTFPYLEALTVSLDWHKFDKCEHYVGRPWICTPEDTDRHPEYCPPLECGPPVDGNFLKYNSRMRKHCWSYMQGGLYVMSSGLVRGVTAPNGTWSHNKEGIEDALTGKMVALWGRENKTCISSWNPYAYMHWA